MGSDMHLWDSRGSGIWNHDLDDQPLETVKSHFKRFVFPKPWSAYLLYSHFALCISVFVYFFVVFLNNVLPFVLFCSTPLQLYFKEYKSGKIVCVLRLIPAGVVASNWQSHPFQIEAESIYSLKERYRTSRDSNPRSTVLRGLLQSYSKPVDRPPYALTVEICGLLLSVSHCLFCKSAINSKVTVE